MRIKVFRVKSTGEIKVRTSSGLELSLGYGEDAVKKAVAKARKLNIYSDTNEAHKD